MGMSSREVRDSIFPLAEEGDGSSGVHGSEPSKVYRDILLRLHPRCFGGEPYPSEPKASRLPVCSSSGHMEEVKLLPMVNDTMVTDVDNNGGSIVLALPSQEAPRTGRLAGSAGAFGLFRAVFMSFSGRDIITKHKTDEDATPEKNKVVGVDSKPPATASWKSIVDGMRPLRLPGQELEYYPPPPPPLAGHVDVYQDVLLAPPSPMLSGSERGMTSRYASAQDLHLLDCGDDEEEGGAVVCPHAIDMQAEEFIAKFYEQFRLQKSELSFDGRATEDEPIDQLACM
ncbi:hypothetical protein PR202_ga22933 [Eleusine coracana subsp. coracana]|uniref:Uncharacterized protein n=1 Tax=Eleusine coracana subsp. coracana TaxID=191504 RepID=A0AAV5D4X4_ELECO|nr:hypothetical protein PR202_ga22933 [Eleusine coracana subsp. coracana]